MVKRVREVEFVGGWESSQISLAKCCQTANSEHPELGTTYALTTPSASQ